MPSIHTLVSACLGKSAAAALFSQMDIHPALTQSSSGDISRAVLAQALNMVLFHGLLERVPVGKDYVEGEVAQNHRKIVFDHGAVRTVRWPCGDMPQGEEALVRIFRPLGFKLAATYPLPKLKMTGRAYCHQDFPQDIAQFFVSELHPEQFSPTFQDGVTRVLASSKNPLNEEDMATLALLDQKGELAMQQALKALPKWAACFEKQHADVALSDYELLLPESAEMAWIATEGNAFNHATDRVQDVHVAAQQQRQLGRQIKYKVEVSSSARVRQTAFVAARVERAMTSADGFVMRSVPGSFFELISRDVLQADLSTLDLAFDAGNATGIFGMTQAKA
ncbi:MAG: DUF1338 family protein [Comamonadaceae bacterium]|nr:MAG: DUF1338 family protein [Comamonadaceae bacterium]